MTHDLIGLIARLENEPGDAGLTIAICEALDLGPKEWFGSKVIGYSWETGVINTEKARHLEALRMPTFLTSLDSALSLVEKMLPGCWYVLGKGKMKSTEPLFGAQLMFGSDEALGEGEHNNNLSRALLIALLRALEAKEQTK